MIAGGTAMKPFNPLRTGIAAALTAAVVSVVCAVAVYLSPLGTVRFVNSWTHGLDLTVLRTDEPLTAARFLLGLFNASLTAFAVGALFAWTRGLLGKVPGGTGE